MYSTCQGSRHFDYLCSVFLEQQTRSELWAGNRARAASSCTCETKLSRHSFNLSGAVTLEVFPIGKSLEFGSLWVLIDHFHICGHIAINYARKNLNPGLWEIRRCY